MRIVMFDCQRMYQLYTLVLCNVAYQDGPDDCFHNGHFYPIYSKWASTVPLECAEYQCHDKQRMTKKE